MKRTARKSCGVALPAVVNGVGVCGSTPARRGPYPGPPASSGVDKSNGAVQSIADQIVDTLAQSALKVDPDAHLAEKPEIETIEDDDRLPVPGADFEMDFHLDSDEEIMNQFLDPSDVTGELIGDDEGVLDYGMYTRTTENSTCAFCHEQFDSKASLLIHKTCYFLRKGVEAVNQGQKPYAGARYQFECEEEPCDIICQDLPQLKLHMLTHWGGMFECKECNYKSAAETHMRQHLITHTGEKPYQCNRCEKAFTQSHSLKTHIESAHFNVQFKCKETGCDLVFNSMGSMKQHYRTYHLMPAGEPTLGEYICTFPDCGRSFGTEKNRLIHTTKKHPGFKQQS